MMTLKHGAGPTAVVVLGCTVELDGSPVPALARRISMGLRAYQAGAARIVVASGGRRWGDHVEADVIATRLIAGGVAGSDVVRESCSLTPVETALFSSRVLRHLGCAQAGVVPCPWHLPRALRHFRHFGVNAVEPPRDWFDAHSAGRRARLRELARSAFDAAVLTMVRTSP